MRFSASRVVGTIALLACLICPVLEVFDRWDPPIQSGNDTEYTFVIVAMCVGAAYLLVRSILESPEPCIVDKSKFSSGWANIFFTTPCLAFPFTDTSPRALLLRI
jgi:hypothetical protein